MGCSLLVRFIAGPACDRYGPRKTFAACLILGSIPTVCAGGITNAKGLIALRFFVGILGGSFVPWLVDFRVLHAHFRAFVSILVLDISTNSNDL